MVMFDPENVLPIARVVGITVFLKCAFQNDLILSFLSKISMKSVENILYMLEIPAIFIATKK